MQTVAKRHSSVGGDLERVFLRLEELVLANSGEDEFEEVFKLLVAKLWDERSRQQRFGPQQDPEATSRSVSNLLREAERGWPGILGSPSDSCLTPEHLQVCVEALARHRLSDSSFEVMDAFFEFLTSQSAKGAKGQYFTPRHVIEMCVRMLRPAQHETVLDPACGSGGFLVHTLNFVRQHESMSPDEIRRYCESRLWGFDIDARAVRVAKALMVLSGDGSANVMRLNSLVKPESGGLFALAGDGDAPLLTIEDVCRARLRKHRGFDVILTNPPFAGEVRERGLLESYAVSRGRDRIERDVLFIERCVDLLRPGGRMAIVLPHNKFAASPWMYVREWVIRSARVLGVIGLGRNTFLPHTHQKASVLLLRRREQGERPASNERIFFGISEREGKNSKGQLLLRNGVPATEPAWRRVDHDLDELVSAFDKFQESENFSERG